jgi:hypothetical protein
LARSSRAKSKSQAPEPPDDMLNEEGIYPDLKRWVAHYRGYPNVPWSKWDDAMRRAKERAARRKIALAELLPRDEPDDEPAPKPFIHVCPTCGLTGPVEEEGERYCRQHAKY